MLTRLPFPTSLPDFMRLFPDDAACAAHLEKVRWPDGFACQYCRWRGEPGRFPNRSSVVLRCRNCKRDTSLTANTVMQRTHTPISIWFWAAYLVSSQTPGMSAVQFQRQLGLKAWLNGVHHGVSPQHLQAYLNEFTFRFNRRFFPFNAFRSLVGLGAATEPTTYDALYNAECRPKLPGRKAPVGN